MPILSFVNFANCSENSVWPTSRACHKMVYLPTSNQIFLFGGVHDFSSDIPLLDTWLYNLNDSEWEQLQTVNHPPPRFSHGLVYEPSLEIIVLFGGFCLETQLKKSDTWIFDLKLKNWELIEDSGPMAERSDCSLIYDPIYEKILLFGGGDEHETMLNDMWYFDYSNRTWCEIEQGDIPFARYGHEMVYCDSQNACYMFGGRTSSGTMDQFYHFDSSSKNWTEKWNEPQPGVRYWHSMAYSLDADQIIIFGGRDSEYIGANILGDTWLYKFNQDSWMQMDLQINPSARLSSNMVYCMNSQSYFLFGGTTGISDFHTVDDLWEFACTTDIWREIEKMPSKSINAYPLGIFFGITFIFFAFPLHVKKYLIKKS